MFEQKLFSLEILFIFPEKKMEEEKCTQKIGSTEDPVIVIAVLKVYSWEAQGGSVILLTVLTIYNRKTHVQTRRHMLPNAAEPPASSSFGKIFVLKHNIKTNQSVGSTPCIRLSKVVGLPTIGLFRQIFALHYKVIQHWYI